MLLAKFDQFGTAGSDRACAFPRAFSGLAEGVYRAGPERRQVPRRGGFWPPRGEARSSALLDLLMITKFGMTYLCDVLPLAPIIPFGHNGRGGVL